MILDGLWRHRLSGEPIIDDREIEGKNAIVKNLHPRGEIITYQHIHKAANRIHCDNCEFVDAP
jgi:hypothetical protein